MVRISGGYCQDLATDPSYQAHGMQKSYREYNRPGEGWAPPGVTAQETQLEMDETSMKIVLNWCSNLQGSAPTTLKWVMGQQQCLVLDNLSWNIVILEFSFNSFESLERPFS